jgi:hypothetical protein
MGTTQTHELNRTDFLMEGDFIVLEQQLFIVNGLSGLGLVGGVSRGQHIYDCLWLSKCRRSFALCEFLQVWFRFFLRV